jgi:nucleoid-associated protein YgaU
MVALRTPVGNHSYRRSIEQVFGPVEWSRQTWRRLADEADRGGGAGQQGNCRRRPVDRDRHRRSGLNEGLEDPMSTAALAADELALRQAPEAVPSPGVSPRRRPRIAGTTTERPPVRACSGEELGRHVVARVGNPGRQGVRVHREAEAPALRLTRRGRMLVMALSVIVFGSAIVVLGLRVTGILEPGPSFTHTVPIQVAPGQTLWSIAQQTNPTKDPVIVVEKIANLNKLATPADITPGQTLQIPIAR